MANPSYFVSPRISQKTARLGPLVEETRDPRLPELACADEERSPRVTLQYKVIAVNAAATGEGSIC
jgi:hypothetical protein